MTAKEIIAEYNAVRARMLILKFSGSNKDFREFLKNLK